MLFYYFRNTKLLLWKHKTHNFPFLPWETHLAMGGRLWRSTSWNVILANLLLGLIISLGILILIVPGIIFACKLAFVPFLVMDKKLNAMDAIRKSWEMTCGYTWRIFVMGIVSFCICILGLICLIVGIFPALMWIIAAFATMYESVLLKVEQPSAGGAG